MNVVQLGMASALETLCGQAFGAKKYHMLGVYMQRSWIVLFFCCILLLPTYLFTTPVLKFLGQPDDIAELSGVVSVWVIPLHFAFALSFPLQRFLQCQLKNQVRNINIVLNTNISLGFLFFLAEILVMFLYSLRDIQLRYLIYTYLYVCL